MKAHFFDTSNPITIIGFLGRLKLACDTNKIHERAAVEALPYYVKHSLANGLHSYMCAEGRSALLSVSVREDKTCPRTLLQSYPEVLRFFLKKFVTDQAIAKHNVKILLYMQSANMTSRKFADFLIAESCKGVDVYDESATNNIFIKRVGASISSSLQDC